MEQRPALAAGGRFQRGRPGAPAFPCQLAFGQMICGGRDEFTVFVGHQRGRRAEDDIHPGFRVGYEGAVFAHGQPERLGGCARVQSDQPLTDSLKRHKSYNGGVLTLKSVRAHKDGAIARFAEVVDRNAAEALRSAGIDVILHCPPDGESSSFKSQMKKADASGAQLALIIGPDELARNEAQLKDLRGGEEQRAVPLDGLLGTVIDALVATSE